MLHGRSRVERPGAQCGGIARGQDSGVIILSAVPASWASTARFIQAADVELVHTNVEVHLFGVDGFALLDEPVLCASRPDRLLVDVARLGELITPDTRMDSMVGRMAFPEASGLVVSALTMLGVDGWWRKADTPPIAEWGAARTLAQLVCEANFASAHRSERMLLQSALAVSATPWHRPIGLSMKMASGSRARVGARIAGGSTRIRLVSIVLVTGQAKCATSPE